MCYQWTQRFKYTNFGKVYFKVRRIIKYSLTTQPLWRSFKFSGNLFYTFCSLLPYVCLTTSLQDFYGRNNCFSLILFTQCIAHFKRYKLNSVNMFVGTEIWFSVYSWTLFNSCSVSCILYHYVAFLLTYTIIVVYVWVDVKLSSATTMYY